MADFQSFGFEADNEQVAQNPAENMEQDDDNAHEMIEVTPSPENEAFRDDNTIGEFETQPEEMNPSPENETNRIEMNCSPSPETGK
jgi:hypothetical protein